VRVDGLSLSVSDFVAGALTGQLRWYESGWHGIIPLVLREDLCWHRTCRRRVLLAYRAETLQGSPLDIEVVQAMQGYRDAYSKAQAALPDLADSPWPFRKVLASRCPYCRREIRYQRHDWAGQSATYRMSIGVNVPEQGGRIGLTPHAQWHWGPEARWPHWVPFGGVGPISHNRLEMRPKRLGFKTG
jgi:hypothetical protein